MKKLEIEKTKPTFIISTFKTDIIKVGLVFSISNFFIAKTSLANNWRSFCSSNLALIKPRRKVYLPEAIFSTIFSLGRSELFWKNKIPIVKAAKEKKEKRNSECNCDTIPLSSKKIRINKIIFWKSIWLWLMSRFQ